jgi:hypothetical protein
MKKKRAKIKRKSKMRDLDYSINKKLSTLFIIMNKGLDGFSK